MESFEHTTIPAGCRFTPIDGELILNYLYNKNNGNPLPSNMVIECDVYGEAEQWRKKFEENGEKTLYFYTKMKKKTENGSRVERGTGCYTWRSQKDKPIHIYNETETEQKHIGSVRSFTLVPKKGFKVSGRWVMHEYRLDGDLLNITTHNDYVLCEIMKKKDFLETTVITDTTLKAESISNFTHRNPMEPIAMDTTESTTQVEGQTCNNNMQVLLPYGVWDRIDELEGIISSSRPSTPPPQNWQTQSTSSTKPSALNLAETYEHMGIKFLDPLLISSSVLVPTSKLSGSNACRIQEADSELLWQQQRPPLMNGSSLVNNADSITELSSDSNLWSLENLGKIFLSSPTPVPASTSPLPSESNAHTTLGEGVDMVWDRQHPMAMENNISFSSSCQNEHGLMNNAYDNMEVSLDSNLWTTMYQSMPEPSTSPQNWANQLTLGSSNVSNIEVKTQGQLGILPPELIWDHQLHSQMEENFWSSPYF